MVAASFCRSVSARMPGSAIPPSCEFVWTGYLSGLDINFDKDWTRRIAHRSKGRRKAQLAVKTGWWTGKCVLSTMWVGLQGMDGLLQCQYVLRGSGGAM